jgi:3-oxoacyl-[acyl-carrier protein] reductase
VESTEFPIPIFPDLAGKTGVVTGGSKGIGAALCRLLVANGVRVAVNARSKEGVDALVAELKSGGGEAIGVLADVSRSEEVARMREAVGAELGDVDLLFAFAGGFGAYTAVHEISDEEWQTILDDNLTSTFLTIRSFLPRMIERRRGSIVTMSSISGRYLDAPTTASYAAAKAGVVALTQHAALELGQYGIRLNSIAPGTTLSERVERLLDDDRHRKLAGMSPLGRLGTPEDSAAAALYLASDAASWLTGVTIDVTGGRVML